MSCLDQLHGLGGCPRWARGLRLTKRQRKRLKRLKRELDLEHAESLSNYADGGYGCYVLLGAMNLVEGILLDDKASRLRK